MRGFPGKKFQLVNDRAAGGVCPLVDQRKKSAYAARPGESRLAESLWPRTRRHAVGLWNDGREAVAPGIARLARRGVRPARLEHEAPSQADSALDGLSPILAA